VRLGGANILTGVPRECTVPIRLPKETGLVCMPIGEKDWTAVSYRLDDNFKADGKWDQPIWRVGSVDDAVTHALAVLRQGPPPRARGLQPLSALIPRVNHARLLAARSQIMREVTRRHVAEEVSRCVTLPTAPRPAGILHDQVVWVTSPVRIDFAGGWSDTPPICLEQGGTVLNAAVTLNGQYPIQVMAKLSSERRIRVSSIDLGDSRTFTSAAELQDHSDPHDWCAIPKAALVLTGIVPSQRGASLGKWLATLGGGLDLTIFSALPKGSGMGTSSVLGAAVLACLDRVLGVPFDAGRLIRMTSVLEQRMQTGGGWQDQIGGLLPGVKLISTRPGADQTPTIRSVPFDAEGKRDISSRCLLYFTGQKRMARNILGNVVNRYVSRADGVLGIVSALKRGASAAADCLARHDVSGFAARVQEYWELKKKIDPGSTNAGVEELMARVGEAATATLLPGAGGGGFILVIAKSAAAARRLRADLESNPPNPYARVFDFDIDPVGLKVTVL
jgi:galactokinase/mevalonate kinase-like predicted kinase